MLHTDRLNTCNQQQCKKFVKDHVNGNLNALVASLSQYQDLYSFDSYDFDRDLLPLLKQEVWDWGYIVADYPEDFDEWDEEEKIKWAKQNNLEPDYRPALEHWAVSDWLASQLKVKGKMVGKILGFNVWGRTTTGQAVHLDGVIEEIAAESRSEIHR